MHTSADSEWTLDLRQGKTPSVSEGPPADSPDLTLTINDDNFAKLVAGKLGQQQVCCTACRYSRLRNFDASQELRTANTRLLVMSTHFDMQAFLLRKLKIKGSMGLAMKLVRVFLCCMLPACYRRMCSVPQFPCSTERILSNCLNFDIVMP